MDTQSTRVGRCFCGDVTFEVTGDPLKMGYCHCTSCRIWSAGPVNAFSLWKPEAVRVIAGQEHIGTYYKTDRSHRSFCKRCGGHLWTDHPPLGLIDVYAALIDGLEFQPALHIHYGERMISIPDDLPKFRDLPAELGGSGEQVAASSVPPV
jgi:hypothetical protein